MEYMYSIVMHCNGIHVQYSKCTVMNSIVIEYLTVMEYILHLLWTLQTIPRVVIDVFLYFSFAHVLAFSTNRDVN